MSNSIPSLSSKLPKAAREERKTKFDFTSIMRRHTITHNHSTIVFLIILMDSIFSLMLKHRRIKNHHLNFILSHIKDHMIIDLGKTNIDLYSIYILYIYLNSIYKVCTPKISNYIFSPNRIVPENNLKENFISYHIREIYPIKIIPHTSHVYHLYLFIIILR